MRRSASFCGAEARPSRIPVASRTRRTEARGPRPEKEVWGVGSGSWGKRQQQLRLADAPSRPLDDDDDACSEVSFSSTMSVDRSCSSRRFVLHCPGDAQAQHNGTPYLTPTQRTNLLNKQLRAKLKQALEEVSLRDTEISRLTQECVELRMKQARLSAADESPTPPGIDRDSLDSSAHSELPEPSRPPDILDVGRRPPDNCLFNSLPVLIQQPVWPPEKSTTPAPSTEERECQTEARDDVEEQLKAAQEALIESKVQLSRARKAAESSQAEVTLQFLKSAFYHLVTDSSQGMSVATKSHWRAIQSILGFSPDECHAMDAAVAAGAFPGPTW